ncbi:GA-like domain-containing protein [Escherichia coli]|uniref:GA-like domain-containing protein n=3 Tax=Escherichia coli TaxID=562 RepID=UPI003CC91118
MNPDEHTELTAKNQAVTDAKNPAEAAVNALPEGDVKAELKGRLDAVDGISVPEVNDQNGNGKPDAQDAKDAEDAAKALVEAAEAKQAEAEGALTAVNALPEGDVKAELKGRLDAVDGISVPEVNDQNGNGKPDAQDAKDAEDAAKALVEAAEAKQAEAEGALTEANKDGAINPDEHTELTAKNQAVTDAKNPAEAAVNALPEGDVKAELKGRLDAVDGISVPEVNDQNGNGKPDAQDAKDAEDAAKALVEAAEAKQAEAEGALTEANKDGAINPDEHTELTAKNQAVTDAKNPAEAAVNALPEGDVKAELKGRLDAVDGISVPEVNDQNGNGKPDAQDAKDAEDAAKALVEAAEAKQAEAEGALTEANKDGAINPDEHTELTAKNQAVTDAKNPAEAAVNALPEGDVKAELKGRLDAVDGISVPEVNDQNGNGKPDAQDAKDAEDAAKALVEAAEAKQAEAEGALTEANKDGAINPDEHTELTAKNQAVTDAKNPAEAAVNALPEGDVKAELKGRLDAVDGISVPEVNDQNGNGKPDAQDAKDAEDAAKALVEAAEAKQAEAEGALTEANKDGAINPDEHTELTAKNQAVTDAKNPAEAAVNALPEGDVKAELKGRLDAVDGISVPEVNDQNGNGKPDAQDAKDAEDAAKALVEAAEAKQAEAEGALTEANKDGAINPDEHTELTAKNQAVTDAKNPAEAAVNALPEGDVKAELKGRLDAVDGISVPEVNDQNGNGKPDAQDAKDAEDAAKALVEAAEAKQAEAEGALTEANKDGAINPDEHTELTAKNQAVTDAKNPAEAAVNALPEGDVKAELKGRLDAVDGISVPEVNDQNGNGKPDAQDAKDAEDAAKALVEAAEAKQAEAEGALTEANKDGAINPDEHTELTAKNQAVTDAKNPAEAAVNALPEGDVKAELKGRLDAVDGISVPEVNDQNGNGKPDAQDAKDAEDAAKALVEAAEAKQAEAEGALTEANKDGAINPDEHTELTAKNQAVTDAKNPAEAAVNALPEGDVKAELKGRLDAVDGISVPEVNDQNGNGKPDAQDAKDAEDAAKALVEAAEAKQAEAEGALTEANKDGAINPDEHTELTAKNQAVTDAKNPAEAAVNALPEGDVKAELKGRLDAVDGISVPEVNDQNGNGKPDAQDAKDAEDAAKALVEAAEAKQAEAEGALTEANKDGAINPDEHTELTAKNQAVTDAKNPAEAAVNALPEGDVKAELKGRLDAVDGISVPEVNDQNGNGKPDAQDAKDAEDAAKALVEAAEAKQAEAEGALTEANKDGAINPDEHTELTAKNQAVTDAKNPAEAAVNALPEGDVKAELKGRLDAVDGISVPEVNDQNGNGKPDAQDAKDAEDAAKALVEAAEAKQAEAEGALTEANKDGAINPDEHTELTAKNQAVTDAKNPAEAAVNALPEGDVKAELKGRLDAVDGISVPEVNDQNGNGKPDAQDAKDAEDAAKALVEAAEAKQAEAEGALTEANKDGAINPDEHTELTAKNQAVTDAKNPAEAAVNALPEGDVKAELKGRLDAVDGISVPEVNDQNGNGKPDAQDAKDAEDAAKALVEAAEAKQAEAEGALTEANKDGAINPDEHTELTAKNQAVTDAKNPAEAAVNALPEGDVKAELKGRLDAVDGISVPEVNDQNGNGKPDAQDAKDAEDAAKALVEAAEAKQAEAEGALTEANKDGAINPDEHTELTAKNQAVTDAKNPAEAAVNALPEGDVKAELKGRLDAVDGISVPEVNDQNGNGKPDAQDAAAAVAFYERALPSNVSGDLYPQPSTFGDKVSSVSKNWSTLLDSNPGSYVTSQRLDSGANQYNYNGHTGSDVISIIDSLGGLDRTQASRFPVGLFTGEGNDLIVTGKDYGRNTSAGYTDHSHRTDMGNGDDTLVVGVGNNDVTLYVNEEGQLRATTDSYNGSTSIDYTGINSSSSGGTISGTDIVMGAGNDTVLALGYEGNSADAIINTNIDLGAGNDFIYANGEISTNNGTQVNIIGGEGFDTISLDNTTVTSAMFSGFEHVDLHSTSHLILNSDDFKSQDIEEGILKISGSSGASVDVQNFDWENLGSTNDGDVKYLTYQSSDIPGLTLWIQEGIEVK